MTLDDFLAETRAEITAQMSEGSPFAELVFCEVVKSDIFTRLFVACFARKSTPGA